MNKLPFYIECHFCEATVDATVIGRTGVHSPDEDEPDYTLTLAKCPHCEQAFLGHQQTHDDVDDNEELIRTWDQPVRIWPLPTLEISRNIPKEIRNSLSEANICLKAGAYTASVAMSGRALEGVGRHFCPSEQRPLMLSAGLQQLKDAGKIDARLWEWGKELADDRNWAAHPSGAKFNHEDAKDVFKFTYNICEYIFVLTNDFEQFQRRKAAQGRPKK